MEMMVRVEIPFDEGQEMTCQYAPVLGMQDSCPYYKPLRPKGVLKALVAPATARCTLFRELLTGGEKCDRCKSACMGALFCSNQRP